MDILITPEILRGTIDAIESKSVAHRLLICASMADIPTEISVRHTNKDIESTADCLNALGADITYNNGVYRVCPIKEDLRGRDVEMNCGESGSTLRFLLPLIGALGVNARIKMEGRLPKRPLSPLKELLESKGMKIQKKEDILLCEGSISHGKYSIDGGVSSQFISGLMFALSRTEGQSEIVITGNTESQSYIDMTFDALKTFGADICPTKNGFKLKASLLKSPEKLQVEGDWSNGAFWLCASHLSGCMGGGAVTLKNMNLKSLQGDMKILDVLKDFGTEIIYDGGLTCLGKESTGILVDAKDIPDLVPVICAVAATAKGRTTIVNAQRLRLKESDRIEAVYRTITSLGGKAEITDDGLIIDGVERLSGGEVDGFGDHRIVMTAAIASLSAQGNVIIRGAEAVSKSYPDFWKDFKALGGNYEIIKD